MTWPVEHYTAEQVGQFSPSDIDREAARVMEQLLRTTDEAKARIDAIAPAGSIVLEHADTGETESFNSIVEALAEASAGDLVRLGSGTYSESFTMPDGVALIGSSWRTVLIDGAAETGVRITMGRSSMIRDLTVLVPTDAAPAVLVSEPGIAICERIYSECPAVGSGSFMEVTNPASVLSATDCVLQQGIADAGWKCTAGRISGRGLVVTASCTAGVGIDAVSGIVEVDGLDFADAVVTIAIGIRVGAAQLRMHNAYMGDGVDTGIHITSDSSVVQCSATRLSCDTLDLLVDPGLSAGTFVFGGSLNPANVSAPGAWMNGGTNLQATITNLTPGDTGIDLWGEIHVGRPERGSETCLGEGDSYTRGMVVLTTDGTASDVADGGNLTDVSEEAASSGGSTFGFQGKSAGHRILFGSSLENSVDKLKIWGIKVSQAVAMSVDGEVVFEIWDGSAWVEIGVMATDSSLYHRYARNVFWRASSSEHIRFGVDEDTAWAKKAIDGTEAYWASFRIVTEPTTAPTFEQFKLSPSRSEDNEDGTRTAHGRARWRRVIPAPGASSGGGSGVNSSTPVGVGSGVPTGWNDIGVGDNLNNTSVEKTFRLNIPPGTDTSFGLRVVQTYWASAGAPSADVDFVVSCKPQRVVGVEVADVAGGRDPVPRTSAQTDTFTTQSAQAIADTLDVVGTGRPWRKVWGPFNITDYYEGDLIFLRAQMTDDGPGSADIVNNFEIQAVSWCLGEKL